MDQEIQKTLDSAKEKMSNSIIFLEKELLNIRAGKANPVMLNSVSIDYYGNPTPLNQLSSINTPDARSISVQPWEKSLLPDIEKAIIDANLGFNPMNNGESILINIPPLTEERRRELVKLAKGEAENAKINIRNTRKDANHSIKKMMFPEDLQKNAEIDIQNLTDKYIARVDSVFSSKEKEILTL